MLSKLFACLLVSGLAGQVVEGSPTTSPASLRSRGNTADLILGRADSITLLSDGKVPDILIIDYDQDVEGFPTFEIVEAKGDTSVFEVTYGETRAAVDQYPAAVPLAFAAAMDSYPINKYNITGPSVISHDLIQGAFRYQKLNISSAGSLVIKNVGVKPTTDTTPLDQLAGRFECSDEDLTRIWRTGARTVQLTEIPKNTIPDFWKITEEGALVDSLVPQILAQGVQLLTYKVQFEVKPLTGQFGFLVLGDTLNTGIYISCDITNGIVSAYVGSSKVDRLLDSAKLPKTFPINEWHTVDATVDTAQIKVSLDGQVIFDFTQTEKFYGSFGLGTDYGHAAVFRNLNATTLAGSEIYSSTLKDRSFLDDFLMGTNPHDTIVDGSRRDRIAYSGDLDIAVAASFASTFARSFVDGTIDLLGSFQTTEGFFIPTAKIQQQPLTDLIPVNITGLIGYSFNLLTAVAYNYEMTGDSAFAKRWAPKYTSMLDWAHSQAKDGLFSVADPSFGGDWNYYDPPQAGIVSKFNSLYAYSLLQGLPILRAGGVDVSVYQQRLEDLYASMNENLWSESLGAYVMSDKLRDGFAQDANAIAILAGIPSGNASAERILSTLADDLILPAGPLAFSENTIQAGWARKISPFASSYHLRAAFQSNETETAKSLLTNLWAPMANPSHENYTNCFWETLEADGSPGLGLGTSLCHGWGAGPSAELTRYVLGIQPVEAGFKQWRVAPLTLGLEWAKGRLRTVQGDINVEWKFENSLLSMESLRSITRLSREKALL
ncbi:related to alpha-L-rhamnosidase C [Cephalotrichum gorgonifer]|uniref:Related to alpha-L-rhamnosidase C n=1 Tax=Cephalotrichum gorgonifer TaxID=2041049 RepID=A0AAE8N7X6_9PEZI|nr:related to alpha-L-rhamnosidase C [Cephalotrichum gorgonifer]